MFIRLVSLGIILKLIDLFEFDFTPFYEEEFEKYLKILISVYFAIFVVINFALWISEQAQFKNFGSMLATICFFTFVVSLFHMKIERDQYRKNLELEYKEFSEQQMSRYMAEIQSLYSIVRGFRHDLGNLVISMSLAIEEENIPEIRRIHREVLEKIYKKINAEELSGFNLVNIRDYAIIVFITTKSEFASITYRYKVSALDFIDKNLNEDLFRLKIKECIEYLTTIQIGNDDLTDYFEYDFKDKKIKIPFKDILYIETVGSAYKLNLVGKNFQKEIAGSLSDVLEKDVEERYFSPHQSYIVNRSMIIGMDKKKKQLLLKEGYSCPISRSNIKRVKKLIEEQNLEFSA